MNRLIEMLAVAAGDDAVPDGAPLLIDVRDSEGKPAREEVVAFVAALHGHQGRFGDQIGALVSTMVQYGMGRVGSLIARSRGIDVTVFRDEDAAIAELSRASAAAS